MRHSPFATLALALASLFPAHLSAHSHPSRLPAPSRHFVAHDLRSSHVQHPQPALFRPLAREPFQRHKGHTLDRTPHHHSILATPLPRSRRISRRERDAAPSLHTRNIRHHSRRSNPRELNLASADSPSQPASVVSIIRPTADHPQLGSVQQAATDSLLLPSLYNDRGRLVVPAPLLGSHEILVRQNTQADQDGLGRVQDDADLDGMRLKRMLVGLPAGEALHVDDRLPYNRRFCRPWTAQFLSTLAHDFYTRFHTPLQVNSAVRTVQFQLRLQRTNGNAAPAEGDTASPHLTGQAVDIAKRGLTLPEIAWLRGYLLPLMQDGRVDVEEEFQQSCFHISVYRRYLPPETAPLRYTASSRTASTAALAVAIR
ncbi:MAG: hypothetical protein NVSMB3_15310 [Acidobacteriaceae bacterium]